MKSTAVNFKTFICRSLPGRHVPKLTTVHKLQPSWTTSQFLDSSQRTREIIVEAIAEGITVGVNTLYTTYLIPFGTN